VVQGCGGTTQEGGLRLGSCSLVAQSCGCFCFCCCCYCCSATANYALLGCQRTACHCYFLPVHCLLLLSWLLRQQLR